MTNQQPIDEAPRQSRRNRLAHWLHDLVVSPGQRWHQIDQERRYWKGQYQDLADKVNPDEPASPPASDAQRVIPDEDGGL